MDICGWPPPNTIIRTARPIWFENIFIPVRTWGTIVPPVPSGAIESADDRFVILVGPLRIPVTRADIRHVR